MLFFDAIPEINSEDDDFEDVSIKALFVFEINLKKCWQIPPVWWIKTETESSC